MIFKNKILGNVFSLGIVQMVNFIFPLVTIPYLSRIIGPSGYGIINYATSFVLYFIVLISYGFDYSATRQIVQSDQKVETLSLIFSKIIYARIILFIVSIVIFIVAVFFINKLNDNLTVSFAVFASTLATVLAPQYFLQGMQKLRPFAMISFVRGLMSTILIFILITSANDYIYVPVITSSVNIFASLLLIIFVVKNFNLKFKIIRLKTILKLLWTDRILYFSNFVISLYTSTNIVVLGFFASVVEIGYLTVAQNFTLIVLAVIAMPIGMAIFPVIGSEFKISQEKGILKFRKVLPIVFYITFICSLILYFSSDLIISLVYGGQFKNSVYVLQVMAFVPFFATLANLMGVQVMINLNLDKLFLKATTISAFFGFGINLYLCNIYGYIGCAWAFLITEIGVLLIMIILLLKNKINVVIIDDFSITNTYRLCVEMLKR